MEQARETAGTTMRFIVDFVRRSAGEDGVRRLLELAGEQRPLSVLEDERVWSSYAAKVALLDAAAAVTGHPDVGRRIGEGVLQSQVGASLKLLIGLVGSPSQLVRGIARAGSKFSTAADLSTLSSDRASARIRYRVRDGYTPHRHDCGYTMGLLSQVSAVFGLPPATVQHDLCQVRGADACLYTVRWQPQSRRPRFRRGRSRTAAAGASAGVVYQRLRDLQETVAELVAGRSVDEVLTAVTERARCTVGAQRFLLATRLAHGEAPRIHADGFTAGEADRTAALLLAGQPPDSREHVIVADVRSMAHDYGCLAAFGRTAFFEHEKDLLRAYASLAATALDAITALDAVRDRQHVAEVLLRFARELLDTHDMAAVARTTARAAVSLSAGDTATMLLYDEGEGLLRVVGSSGWSEELEPLVAEFVIRPENTPELADLLVHPDEPRVYDRDSEDAYVQEVLQTFQTAQLVVMPLRSPERFWGIVITAWGDGGDRPVVQRLFARLAGLADQAVAALQRAELTEQVHRQANVDALTGVANRLAFTGRLRQCLDDDATAGRGAGVVFLDLDRFKTVNDTLGHSAGDDLLCTVALRLQSLVRPDDLVARLGGDEFTILLSTVDDPDRLARFADRIVRAFADPVLLAGHAVHARPSVGAVLVSPEHATVSDVLRHADAAMYAAKRAGGNGYAVYGHDSFASAAGRLRVHRPDADRAG